MRATRSQRVLVLTSPIHQGQRSQRWFEEESRVLHHVTRELSGSRILSESSTLNYCPFSFDVRYFSRSKRTPPTRVEESLDGGGDSPGVKKGSRNESRSTDPTERTYRNSRKSCPRTVPHSFFFLFTQSPQVSWYYGIGCPNSWNFRLNHYGTVGLSLSSFKPSVRHPSTKYSGPLRSSRFPGLSLT